MRKTFFILSVIFISLLIIQCNRGDKELHKKLVQIATGLNASTPVMLDQYTRLEEATVTPDNVFRYHYSVVNTNNPDSLLENMSQALVKNMKTAFRSEEHTSELQSRP